MKSMYIRSIFFETLHFVRRLFIRTDQKYKFQSSRLVLPRNHRLPMLQHIFENYDRYFYDFFKLLSLEFNKATIIDIGANVGDTTVAVLEIAPHFNSIAVEGAAEFLAYLLINTEKYGERVSVVSRFVQSERMTSMSYRSDGTTGGFAATSGSKTEGNLVTVDELLSMSGSEFIIWKSDTDGLDIPIFIENWNKILEKSQILWLEIHPNLYPTTMNDVKQLCELIESESLIGVLFDNFGNLIDNNLGLSLSNLIKLHTQNINPHSRRGQKAPFYYDIIVFSENTFSIEFQRALTTALGWKF